MDSIEYFSDLNFLDSEGYESFMDWITLRKEMMTGGRTWEKMDASDKATLEFLASNFTTRAGQLAIAVLDEYTSNHYFIPPAFGNDNTPRRTQQANSATLQDWVSAYPNPADHLVTIELSANFPLSEDTELIVTDLLGREVYRRIWPIEMTQTILNTSKWETGMYFFEVISPKFTVSASGKFDVAH